MKNNKINLVGRISTELRFSHISFGESFLTFDLEVMRTSGTVDTIPIIISKKLTLVKYLLKGDFVEILGEIRTHNEYDEDGTKHLKICCFVKYISKSEFEYHKNEVKLRGFICTKPLYRISPLGRKITDVIFAVNRDYDRTDYIPCIAWGRNAIYIGKKEVGTELLIDGRLQSRDYIKHYDNDVSIEKRAFELSINTVEEIKKIR